MTDPFNKISDKDKVKLLKNLEALTFNFKKDTPILSTIKADNIIGIILEGSILITKTDYNGNRTIVEELEENAVFGSSLSSLSDSECEVITKEDTKLIIVDYSRLFSDDQTNSYMYNQFIRNLLEITTNIVGERNERIEMLTKKTIRNKLLAYFSIISKKHGSRNIYLPFSFTDLADYLAIDRSAMSRELGYLKEEGFIEVKARMITLLYR